jgi:hypothetical protein
VDEIRVATKRAADGSNAERADIHALTALINKAPSYSPQV